MSDEETPILIDWRQGDLALAAVELPLMSTEEGEPVVIFAAADHGVALLSQSCDVVRSHLDKQFVQVAGLVPVDGDEMERVKAGHAPARVYLAALADRMLVVDLDTVATVEKATVASWERTVGCPSDEDQRQFAAALARHRQRFAFPDDFNDLVKPVRRWIEGKRSSDSSYGRLVRAIREIRVAADDWDAPSTLNFLVLLDAPGPAGDLRDWESAMTTLTKKGTHPAFPTPEFTLTTYDDISARDYVTSDRLDWDGLSDV